MGRLTSRSRALIVVLCLALCVCGRAGANQVRRENVLVDRQLLPTPSENTPPANTNTNTNSNANTNTNTDTKQTATNTATNTNTNTNTATGTPTTPTNTQTTPTNTGTSTQSTPPTTTQQPTDSVVATTNQDGSTVMTTVVVTPSAADTASSSASSPAQTSDKSNDSGGGGFGTGSIIGVSVAGGIAVIGVIGFFIWKFTRKRYSDFDDEPIKWPELNAHNDNLNYALPTTSTRTGGTSTGAGTGLDSASEVNLARNASNAGYSAYSQPSQYSHPTAADSTADLYAPGGDPYAVPPLPHLNPNQPYRDDPSYAGGAGAGAGGAYYDPYRGPVPQAFNDAASVSTVGGPHGGEAIPMSNLAAAGGPTGRRSPGPQMGLDMGRMSPQPAMSGRQSPGPSLAYGGRTTPGLGGAMSGRHSPGPGQAYGGGY